MRGEGCGHSANVLGGADFDLLFWRLCCPNERQLRFPLVLDSSNGLSFGGSWVGSRDCDALLSPLDLTIPRISRKPLAAELGISDHISSYCVLR